MGKKFNTFGLSALGSATVYVALVPERRKELMKGIKYVIKAVEEVL